MNYQIYKFILFKNDEIYNIINRECATDKEINVYAEYLLNKYDIDKIVIQKEIVKWEFVKEFHN